MSQHKKSKAELEDKVFKLKDVNKDLKGKQIKLQQNLKKAQWEASYFRKKAQTVEKKMKLNNITNVESKELNKMVNVLKNKNDLYRKENLKLRETARNTKTKRQRPKSATKHAQSNQQITTMLKEIRQTLKQNNQENSDYIGPSGNININMNEMALNEVRKELKNKQLQITMLTTKYEELQSNLKADRIIQQRALDQCEKYKKMLQQTEEINQELQQQICVSDASKHEIESLQLYIKNLKGENKSLQERISKLTQNSLLGDQLETQRISQITSSHHTKLSKIQFSLNEATQKLELNEKKLNKTMKAKDFFENESNSLKKSIEVLQRENEKLKIKTKLFEDQSGINIKDLECALELIEKSKRNNKDIDFLNEIEIDKCDDPIILRGKIDELQIKNRDLILECTQNQNLLETQINLNKKLERDYHEVENEYISLKHDNNNIKSEMYRLSQTRNLSNLLVSENELFVKSDIDNICFETTENLLIFKILFGELNPNCCYFKHKNMNPLTMIIVDFFEFESIYSNIYGGYNPKYNLFCQYKIKMDDFFLKYMQNDFISIDFVYKKINKTKNKNANKLKIISNNKISLKHLLVTPDSCIQNEIELISNDDNKEYIGKLSFIAKMLRSVDISHNVKTCVPKQNGNELLSELPLNKESTISPTDVNNNNNNDHDDDIDALLEQELSKIEIKQDTL